MSMTEKLAYIKKLRHLTTEEIARHSGVPVGTLNKIFSGQTRHPAAEPMARLAQSLRVPIRYLLDDALPLECYISLNGNDGPILLSDEEIRLLMRLRELEPRSRRAMGIMAELLGAPAPCLAGGIATRHLFCFLAAGSEAENPAWGVLRPRPVLIPEPDAAARDGAARQNVDMRMYRVIYDCIDEIEAAMKGMLAPKYREVVLGHAEVRQTYKVSSVGTVAGCYVQDGKIVRACSVRVVRDGIVIHEGVLASLKRFKDDAREVAENYECGLTVEKFNDIKEGDIIEAFTMEEIPR